jgi:uncharacterized protein (TIGR02145 family)
MAGYRSYSDGSLNDQGSYGYYWSSSPDSPYANNMYFDSSYVKPQTSNDRAATLSVRCFKNIPVDTGAFITTWDTTIT